jgi:hypothetical protein
MEVKFNVCKNRQEIVITSGIWIQLSQADVCGLADGVEEEIRIGSSIFEDCVLRAFDERRAQLRRKHPIKVTATFLDAARHNATSVITK